MQKDEDQIMCVSVSKRKVTRHLYVYNSIQYEKLAFSQPGDGIQRYKDDALR